MNITDVITVTKILIIGSTLFYSTACKQKVYSEKIEPTTLAYSENDAATFENPSKNQTALQHAINLKIIKSGNVKFKVKNVKIATSTIKQFACYFHGYISDLRFESNPYHLENHFTIKIPQHHFDAMRDSILTVAEFVEYENITTEDITAHYIDLQSRLRTKITVKERYEAILRKKAKTVNDLLLAEEKLRIIQEEIEAAQGKLNYFSDKLSYSTIQIELYETVDFKEKPESYGKSFWSKSKAGLLFGWELITTLLLGIIYIWPLLGLGLLLWYVITRQRNKKTDA